jgi:hypothetical protein
MNTYFYPDWQIREWYNGAKNQVEQVFILADLCAVCYEEMIRYLNDELKLLTPEVFAAVQKQLAELREQEAIAKQKLEERRERYRRKVKANGKNEP